MCLLGSAATSVLQAGVDQFLLQRATPDFSVPTLSCILYADRPRYEEHASGIMDIQCRVGFPLVRFGWMRFREALAEAWSVHGRA